MFKSFQKASYGQWKEQVEKELKGKDFDQFLNWDFENFTFPAYLDHSHASEHETILAKQCSVLHNFRKEKLQGRGWLGAQRIKVINEKKANEEALIHLRTGIDSLIFDIQKDDVDWTRLTEGIQLDVINIHLEFPMEMWHDGLNALPQNIKNNTPHIWTSPWDFCAKYGEFHSDSDAIFSEDTTGIIIDATGVANAGGTMEQQLQYAIGGGLFAARKMKEQGKPKPIRFHFPLSATYFVEIAKIRAFSWLWNALGGQIFENPWKTDSITSESLWLTHAIADEQNNTLRNSTVCMAAILGGSSEHINLPHNIGYADVDFFSARVANNIHHILREESFMAESSDPSFGSFYIERLTYLITQELLKTDWETAWDAELISGRFQEAVHQSGAVLGKKIQDGSHPWLGVNLYPNPNDPNQNKGCKPGRNFGMLNSRVNAHVNA
ncbi:MAG: methylmalonyl-CoA mutase [Luteibaculaceae bacterium]|jgi:methylmalonyl-CoA mutase